MNSLKIALDVDDVLAAFTPHAHKFHNKPLTKVDYWCVDTMDATLGDCWFTKEIAHRRDFWETLPVLNSADQINFPVTCYISSFPPEMFALRQLWLKQHGYPDAPLIVASNKLEICEKLGITHLIDDKPATIQSLQGSSVKGIHFITPYAGFEPVGECVITHLNQVNQYL